MADTAKDGIVQRDKLTRAIVPRIPMGLLTPEILENLARVCRKYDIPVMKITSGQRVALIGIEPGDVGRIWEDLGADVGKPVGACIHYVQACPGSNFCRLGNNDSLGLAGEIERKYYGKDFPAKTKIAVSGCKLSCAESYLRDFGIFATKKGWTLVAGGSSGGRPRIGDVVAEDLADEDILKVLDACVGFYIENAKRRERMPRFIGRVGIEEFKKQCVESI